jgi:hypothetical protein
MSQIKNNPIRDVFETPSEIQKKAMKWLERINVAKSSVEFDYVRTEAWASVSFIYNNKEYTFKSTKQRGYKENLKAIELFLHSRVISIERGIEEFEQAFKGYEQLTYRNDVVTNDNPYLLLDISEIKQLMKKYHTDIPESGNREVFEKLQEAKKIKEAQN